MMRPYLSRTTRLLDLATTTLARAGERGEITAREADQAAAALATATSALRDAGRRRVS